MFSGNTAPTESLISDSIGPSLPDVHQRKQQEMSVTTTNPNPTSATEKQAIGAVRIRDWSDD